MLVAFDDHGKLVFIQAFRLIAHDDGLVEKNAFLPLASWTFRFLSFTGEQDLELVKGDHVFESNYWRRN